MPSSNRFICNKEKKINVNRETSALFYFEKFRIKEASKARNITAQSSAFSNRLDAVNSCYARGTRFNTIRSELITKSVFKIEHSQACVTGRYIIRG
jgi:hypothetical protein